MVFVRNLAIDDRVTFTCSGKPYHGFVKFDKIAKAYYISFGNPGEQNQVCNYIFQYIDVKDKYVFQNNTLGYWRVGLFPPCETLNDLTKLADAILNKIVIKNNSQVIGTVSNVNLDGSCTVTLNSSYRPNATGAVGASGFTGRTMSSHQFIPDEFIPKRKGYMTPKYVDL